MLEKMMGFFTDDSWVKDIIFPSMTTNIGPFLFCHSFSITLFYTPWMTSLNGHIMVIGRLAWSLHIRVTCYILYFESPTHLLGQISSPIVDSITSRNDSVYTLISPSFLGSIWIYQRTLKWFLGRLHRKLFTVKFFDGVIQTRMLQSTCLPQCVGSSVGRTAGLFVCFKG